MTEQIEVTQPSDDVRELLREARDSLDALQDISNCTCCFPDNDCCAWSKAEGLILRIDAALATTTQPDPADVERMEADAAIDYAEGSNPAPKKHPHNELNWTGTPQSVVGFGDELADAADSEPSVLASPLDQILRWHETGGHEGDGSDKTLSSALQELTALRNQTDRKAVLEDGDEVEYLNPDLSYPIKATFRQYVEGWAEIEFWDHGATNPSTAIVRPSRIRNLAGREGV